MRHFNKVSDSEEWDTLIKFLALKNETLFKIGNRLDIYEEEGIEGPKDRKALYGGGEGKTILNL